MVNRNMSKYTIVTLDEVPSTNSYALENIKFFDDKTVIYSPHQTLGRGRYNRKWISDNSENLYMSLILKPENIISYPFINLTQYLSVILCNFLKQEFNINSQVKWPNDILVNGEKISGILAESYIEENKINAVVLGLGLNVNLSKNTLDMIDQKATSVSVLNNGQYYDSETILRKLMDSFFENYDEFVQKGFNFIKNSYISKCGFLGNKITIKEANEKKEYYAKSIDDDGLLIVNDEFNNECKIITGDILC